MKDQHRAKMLPADKFSIIILSKTLVTILLAAGIFILDTYTQLGVAGGVLYVALVLMGLFYKDRMAGLFLGVGSTLLVALGYFISPEGGEFWMVILNRSYSLIAIWVVSIGVIRQKKILEKLERYTDSLAASNKDLEKKVDERTRELAQALEHQIEVSEMKSRFVSLAAHDFRTPLTTVLTSVSLLKKYKDTDQQEKRDKHIERIKISVNNLNDIINDFLSHDKLEQGKVVAQKKTFELIALCNQVIDEVAVIKKKGQEIRYIHHGDKLAKNLDEKLLRNILINLLSNAIKYSGEDKPIELHTDTQNGQLMIEVKDSGIGIPEEDQKNIFKQFFRANNAINIYGIGLGLNIVKHYAEMMGGTIEFNSVAGQGTTFRVQFSQTD